MTTGADSVSDFLSGMRRGTVPAAPVPAGTAAAPPVAKRPAPKTRAPKTPAVAPLPSPGVVSRPGGGVYYPRALGPHADVAALRKCREAVPVLPVLLYGLPGNGKTALAEAAFSDVLTVNGSAETEVGDFVGTFVQTEDNTIRWIDGPLVQAMEEGWPLLIDEVALIDPRVMSVVYSAMDGRNEIVVTSNPARGTVKAQPGFYVIAGCNPNAPGAQMSEALLSRFLIHIEVPSDYDLAKTLGVDSRVIKIAKNLTEKLKSGEVSWAPQLRELVGHRRVCEVLGEETAARNLVALAPESDREIVAGVVSTVFGMPIAALTLGGQV